VRGKISFESARPSARGFRELDQLAQLRERSHTVQEKRRSRLKVEVSPAFYKRVARSMALERTKSKVVAAGSPCACGAPMSGDPVGGTSDDVRTIVSRLARVSDTSQLRIEIQNVARRTGTPKTPHSPRSAPLVWLLRSLEVDIAPASLCDVRREFSSQREIAREFHRCTISSHYFKNAMRRGVKRPRWIPYSETGSEFLL
jgi:hypothetical protein